MRGQSAWSHIRISGSLNGRICVPHPCATHFELCPASWLAWNARFCKRKTPRLSGAAVANGAPSAQVYRAEKLKTVTLWNFAPGFSSAEGNFG